MQFAEGAGEAILHEIVRRGDVASQRTGIAPQARNLCFDAAMDIGHEKPPQLVATGRGPIGIPGVYRRAVIG